MVAVEPRRVRVQSDLAETGRIADGLSCSIFLIHLGVSYAQKRTGLLQIATVESGTPSQTEAVATCIARLDLTCRCQSLLECLPQCDYQTARLDQGKFSSAACSSSRTQCAKRRLE